MKDIAGPLGNPNSFDYLMNVPPTRPIVNFLFDMVKPIYKCPVLRVLKFPFSREAGDKDK